MTKLKMQTPDLTAQNIEKIAELFPNCITETVDENGQPKRAVNFPMLKQMLSGEVLDGDEAYEFTWVGKKASIVEANRPIRKTLRPCIEESRNWDETENLYIEGDNLEVLKLLQESYLGKVKMIYIDPPYNTGNDFIYRDDFKQTAAEYDEESGVFDEDENRLFKNTDSNGRFHSDWCSMIYPRLMLARNLLSDDGVIFISIDDNEQDNLKKICDEVFGVDNFIAQCVRKRRDSQANLSKNISPIHEYILIYSKYYRDLLNKVSANIDETSYKNPDNDPRGPYVTMPCTNKGGTVYNITTPTGKIITDEWRFKKETYDKLFIDNRLVFPRGGDGKPRYKIFLSDKKQEGQLANTWLDNISSNQDATREIKELFNQIIFDTAKPSGLLNFCLELATKRDSIILDFFSGSATTAHAVMQLNAKDSGNRKFIMVQLPENLDENLKKSTGNSAQVIKNAIKLCNDLGKQHILTEIGKERIRRAGDKIKAETGADIDYGFRVFKVDNSNMNDIYYSVAELSQTTLASTLDNIKPDRSALDLLFGCLLDWGLPLSMPYKSEQLGGCTVHTYNEGDLLACFDMDIPEEVLVELAKRQPLRAVFRDSCFADSPAKINVFEIFKLYAPDCTVKVL